MTIRPKCEMPHYSREPDRIDAMKRMTPAERCRLSSHAGGRVQKLVIEHWRKRFPDADPVSMAYFVLRRKTFMEDFLCEWPIPLEIESK